MSLPAIECPKCGRQMSLITWLGEAKDKAIVECPVCAIREVKEIPVVE